MLTSSYRVTFSSICRGIALIPALVLGFSLLLTPALLGQTAAPSPCGVSATSHDVAAEAAQFAHGLRQLPRSALRTRNLKWELPLAAITGALIAEGDRPAADRIQAKSLQDQASAWSNAGLGIEFGTAALTLAMGCRSHNSSLRDTGLTALTAMGVATGSVLVLKPAFNRQYPYTSGSRGEFWEGGRSFPSGHAAASFAFASVFAHRYPHKPWVKWGAYALATGVSLSRYPARKHYASDILVGATIGYLTGTYLAGPD